MTIESRTFRGTEPPERTPNGGNAVTDRYWEADFDKEAVKQRLTESRALYRSDLRDFWLKEFPLLVIAALLAVMSFGGMVGYFFSVNIYAELVVIALSGMVLQGWLIYPESPDEERAAYNMLLNQIGAAAKRRNG